MVDLMIAESLFARSVCSLQSVENRTQELTNDERVQATWSWVAMPDGRSEDIGFVAAAHFSGGARQASRRSVIADSLVGGRPH